MSNLVIVAIPDENDRMWKVSSEKIPHLTLLFLGEMDQISNTEKIIEFVEHAALTTLNRFHLLVDHRGELGDDQADVLFFKKDRYSYKPVRDFRSALLQDNNVRTAYDTATQFEGPWNPHLTLGYPTAPAKKEDDSWGGFWSVDFNKIAVWTGDFEGPEFLLKDYWDEYETLDTLPMDVAMSSLNGARTEAGLDALEHFGTKGMKWGVRKARAAGGAVDRAYGKTVVKADETAFRSRANTSKTIGKLVSQATKKTRDEDLPRINEKYKNQAKTSTKVRLHGVSRVPSQKNYRNEVREAYRKRLDEVANSTTNRSGTLRYNIKDSGRGKPNSPVRWSVDVNRIKHDVEDDLMQSFEVEPVFDTDGYITDIKLVEDSLAQSVDFDTLASEFMLEHFGIKGMKWGLRKAKAGLKAVGRGLSRMGAALAESHWQNSTYSDHYHEQVHNHVAKELDNRVERLQKSPKYKGKNLKADADLRREYYQDVAKVAEAAHKRAVKNVYGENPSGTKSAHFVTDARGPRIEVRDKTSGKTENESPLSSMRDIQKRQKERDERLGATHAATDNKPDPNDSDINIDLKLDANDQIVGVGFIQPSEEDSVAQTIDLGMDFLLQNGIEIESPSNLEHHGVKGMRWGQRKDTTISTGGGGTKQVTAKKAAKLDARFEKNVSSSSNFVALHNGAADHVNSHISTLNKSFEAKHPKEFNDGTLLNDHHPITKEYHKAYNDLFTEGLNKAAEKLGSNPTGTRKVKIYTHNNDSLENFSWGWGTGPTGKAKHADGVDLPDGDIIFVVTLDAQGRITKAESGVESDSTAQSGVESDSTAQSATSSEDVVAHSVELGEAFILEHFGIKGMRWGVRKHRDVEISEHTDTGLLRRQTKLQAKGGESHPAHEDAVRAAVQKRVVKKSGTDALSTQELRDLANRLQVEQQVHTLTSSKGRRFVQKQIEEEGKTQVQRGVRTGVKKGGRHVRRGVATAATIAAL